MPYYHVHEVNGSIVRDEYDSKVCAINARKNAGTGTVMYEPSDDESANWRIREERRFENGQYLRVLPIPGWEYNALHYLHLSIAKTDEGYVAYTASAQDGHEDRQTRTTAGRYAEQFSPDPKTMIGLFVAVCKGSLEPLQIARSSEDIARLYVRELAHSCMTRRKLRGSGKDCVKAYGESDLGIAYVGTLDEPDARVLVWPDKQWYLTKRPYANDYAFGDRLVGSLRAHGYTAKDEFIGARVRRIVDADGYELLPYLDGAGAGVVVDDDDRFFRCVRQGATYGGQRIDGYAGEHRACVCDHCQEAFDGDPDDDLYCPGCDDERWLCDECSESSWDEPNMLRDRPLCDDCYAEHAPICPNCETRYDGAEDDAACPECEQIHFYCEHCEEDRYESTVLEVAGDRYCQSCYDELPECPVCGERYAEDSPCCATEVCHVCGEAWQSVNPDSATLRYLDPFADCPACGAHPRPENHPNLFAELCGAA